LLSALVLSDLSMVFGHGELLGKSLPTGRAYETFRVAESETGGVGFGPHQLRISKPSYAMDHLHNRKVLLAEDQCCGYPGNDA
jgi:hypothetical protein